MPASLKHSIRTNKPVVNLACCNPKSACCVAEAKLGCCKEAKACCGFTSEKV